MQENKTMPNEHHKQYIKTAEEHAQKNLSSFINPTNTAISKIVHQKSLDECKVMNILIPGSGAFPSHKVLAKQLGILYPSLLKIDFHCVDSDKLSVDLLHASYSINISRKKLAVHLHHHHASLIHYLENTKEKFDIVYFEHPPTVSAAIYLDFFQWVSQCFNNQECSVDTYRRAFPLLNQILKKESLIISCMYHLIELCTFKSLIEYAVGIEQSVWKNDDFPNLSTKSGYNTLLMFKPMIKPATDHKHLQQEISFQDKTYGILLTIGIFIWLSFLAKMYNKDCNPLTGLYDPYVSTKSNISFALNILLLIAPQQYGRQGYLVKTALFAANLLLMIGDDIIFNNALSGSMRP